MAVVDPISDMLTRIRNAHLRLHEDVKVPTSKVHTAIAGILKEEGYITSYELQDRVINVELKYADGKPLITGLKKVSTPGRRVYVSAQDIPRVQNGIGICIMSTSHGVLEGENARKENVGGEVLCEIW
jgi:small subunit ribosomal protein S8